MVYCNYKKENKVNDKLILFIIHRKRQLKSIKDNKMIPDLIKFINGEYNQIFIDNLQGKENLDIFKIMSEQIKALAKEFFVDTNFIENKIPKA